ncbi:MAG: sensor histidine kinase [Thermoleophilaceae bacterium]
MTPSSTAALRRLLWPASLALGVGAEAASFGLGDARHWIPDIAAGWTLIACGLVAWSRWSESATGPLMAATGMAWFAGNFSPALVYVHRGPLVQLVLCYPRGRASGRLERAAVAAGYAAAVITPIWDSDPATLALAGAIVLVAAIRHRADAGLGRAARMPGTAAAVALALVLAAGAAARIAAPDGDVRAPTLLAYELTLCAIAVSLLIGLDRAARGRAAVADLVVELGPRSGTLHDALAWALGDPTLELGYWLPGLGDYVDAQGRPLALPAPDSGRRVTRLERAGQPVAALVHDPTVLDDPALVDALAAAARLTAANAELQAGVQAQVAEVAASRRRLVRAGDEERRRLEERLGAGARRRLAALTAPLARSRERAQDPETASRIAQAERQLATTLGELRELAAGLHPAALAEGGLRDALEQLAERCPVPVVIDAPDIRLPIDVEVTVYFVCSEALANVAKYARATRVSIVVQASGHEVVVRVGDDGVGGADPASGSGLRGLSDRLAALGGRLELSSPPQRGTTLTAQVPFASDPLVRGAAGGRRSAEDPGRAQ